MAGKQFFNVYVIGNKYAYKYIRINIITKYALIYTQINRVFVAKFSRNFFKQPFKLSIVFLINCTDFLLL